MDEGVEFEAENTRSNVSSLGFVKLTAIYIDDVEVFSGELDASYIFVNMDLRGPYIPVLEATKMLRGQKVKKSVRIVGEYTGLAPSQLMIGNMYTVVISMTGPASFKS